MIHCKDCKHWEYGVDSGSSTHGVCKVINDDEGSFERPAFVELRNYGGGADLFTTPDFGCTLGESSQQPTTEDSTEQAKLALDATETQQPVKDWSKATERIIRAIEREVSPILQRAVDRALAKFPKAKSISIQDAMGSAWIEIDGLHFHVDTHDTALFECNGYKGNRHSPYRTIRAHRLKDLAEVMLECGEFLDEFKASYPNIKAEREISK